MGSDVAKSSANLAMNGQHMLKWKWMWMRAGIILACWTGAIAAAGFQAWGIVVPLLLVAAWCVVAPTDKDRLQ
jgi:hypothetical protein